MEGMRSGGDVRDVALPWTESAGPAAAASGCLHELFERWADATPEAPALVARAGVRTYAELERDANRLARLLRERDVGPGDFVGLLVERSADAIVAILAVLKAGAAYVPMDPVHPDDRLHYMADEAELALLVTDRALAARAARVFDGETLVLGAVAADLARQSDARPTRQETGLAADDLCYVIYTSGTTGRPKGVMTEHRNAFEFVLAFNDVCATTSADRVYQGFSLCFDGSVEEMWMAYSNGAALVVGDATTPKFGADLARVLTELGVTYFSTVPTMLATMTEDVPTLTQLVVSGEVCPPALVARWARPGRLMLNVYGPTEATVNTTALACEPGRRVTIGRAIPGYTTRILDEALREVAPGESGELFVGGPGLARGYLKQPELTAEKFLWLSVADGAAPERLYRTGDLARVGADGELEFFGRIDGQVKIRGYRVELSEIESVLRECAGVHEAAVAVHERDGIAELAAYVTASAAIDRDAAVARLKERMPDYMVPTYLDVLTALPRLASGKVDRKRLPRPLSPLVRTTAAFVAPAAGLETQLAALWAELFRLPRVSATQDFFTDLGGHSLTAAQMATQLRARTTLDVAVRDVYYHPTVQRLAAELSRRASSAPATTEAETTRPSVAPVGALERRAVKIAQAVSLYLTYAWATWPFLLVVLVVLEALEGQIGVAGALAWIVAIGVATWPVSLLLAVVSKWVLVGRAREGAVPLWSWAYYRWWLAMRLQGLSGVAGLAGTPFLPLYYRAMGARVGRGAHLETALVGAWDLVTVGARASVGPDTQLLGYRVEDGALRFGRVTIGDDAFVGMHAALGLDACMERGARLDDQSLLPDGATIPAGAARAGSPAREASVRVPLPAPGVSRASRRWSTPAFAAAQLGVLYALAFALVLPMLGYLVAALLLLLEGHPAYGALVLASVPLFVVGYALWVALLKRLLGKAALGVHALHSSEHLRQWASDGLMRAARALLLPIFTTVYLPPWLRLVGAKIGARAELSAVWSVVPELLHAEAESFFADGCILGGRRTHAGWFELEPVRVGTRTFVGNSALLPGGSRLGDRCLLGVASVPPPGGAVPDGTDWLGTPSFCLPNRQRVGSFEETATYKPTRRLFLQRAAIDGLRAVLPGYIALLAGTALALALVATLEARGLVATFLLAPLYAGVVALATVLTVVALKWGVMGRFRPVVVPLWCPYVWLNEMLNGVYETVMAPIVASLLGTPLAAACLRLLGCRIGRGVYLETTLFSEFDLVRIGDGAALNAGSIIQTHLFEDRVMKSSHLAIEPEATVGNMAVVLYDATLGRGAWLGPLSLLMKGETLARGRWIGIPTTRA
jgi:non-ribosomal peptide synthetase-like protein